MKNQTTSKVHNYVLLICLAIFVNQKVNAQYSRFTIDASIGSNFMLGSVPSLPGTTTQVTLRYSLSRLVSIGTYAGTGVLWGSGDATKVTYSGGDNIYQNYIERYKFNTEYYTWGGNVYMNVQELLNPQKKPKGIIPYIYAGVGYLRARSESENLQNNTDIIRYRTYFATIIGVQLKFRGSKKFDYIICAQENFTQSPYFDGIAYDNKYDNFISVTAGISYHLCSNNKKNTQIDWTRDNCCPSFYGYK